MHQKPGLNVNRARDTLHARVMVGVAVGVDDCPDGLARPVGVVKFEGLAGRTHSVERTITISPVVPSTMVMLESEKAADLIHAIGNLEQTI